MDSYQLLKAQSFIAGFLLIFGLQYGYVVSQIVFWQKSIDELGVLFVAQTYFNITEIVVCFLF
jgi:hypothetical protein